MVKTKTRKLRPQTLDNTDANGIQIAHRIVQARPVRDVAIKDVKPAKHNPTGRTSDRRLRNLYKSIGAIGLLYPILVTPDYEIIDGHRRYAVMKKLGYESIPAIVVDEEEGVTRDNVYADVNNTQTRMSANEILGIWLANPSAVTNRTQITMKTIESKIGRRLLTELYNQGMSHFTYRRVVQLANYCDRNSPDFIRKALVWAMRYEAAGQIDKIVKLEASPAVIVNAVLEMKPVKLQLAVE